MVFTGDEHAVRAFGTDRAKQAFRERICARAAWRDLDDFHVPGGKHAVEGGGELAVAVSGVRKRKLLPDWSWRGIMRFRAPAVSPRPRWVRGEPEDVDVEGPDLHHEEDV
ncbi:hypothetical protein [Streptomyces sp. NPDC055140]